MVKFAVKIVKYRWV